MSTHPELTRLLENPAIWRGSCTARLKGTPTGFAALDERLPGNGWPRAGLIEILPSRFGIGESWLLMPALSALTRLPAARRCVWVAPPDLPGAAELCPLEPFAPALVAHGLALERVLVVRPAQRSSAAALWAFEQALGSGGCEVALAWVRKIRALEVRRLQLAAERGRALGILFRPASTSCEPSPAALRVLLETKGERARLTILKSRGGVRGSLELSWPGR
jgi:cell division inhibitor SulA/protein ImuA